MKIASVDCVIPSSNVNNREIEDIILYYSKGVFNGHMSILKEEIRRLLNNSGIKTRYWRNRGETPIDLINESFENALKKSNISRKEIDTVIYTGVDRGFIEPANACFISKKIGLYKARTFDIVDACMGWCTSVEIAQSLLRENKSNAVLIVSSEFPMDKNGFVYPENFTIKNIEELDWKFPSLTIGEAASATILVKSKEYWNFFYKSNSDRVDLCTIPLFKYKDYSEETELLKNKASNTFSAYGKKLYFAGYKPSVELLKLGLESVKKEPVAILPHSVSHRVPLRVDEKLDLGNKIYTTFPFLGNLATSSVPAHLHYGLLTNKFKKGNYLLGWVASAGLKYSCFDIYL